MKKSIATGSVPDAEDGAADALAAKVTNLGIQADETLDYELQVNGDDVCLKASGDAKWLAVIDRETMQLENMIESAIGYFPETEVIMTGMWNWNKQEYIVTAFEHYSTERLREKAEAFIGGNEILPEMKEQYGLS